MTSAYTINLNPNITTPVKTGYTFKSGDKGITFNLVVQEMDPTGTSAKIAFHRANGTSVEASLAGGGPNYSYTILGNEFAVPGVVVADVKFYQSTTQRVSTASFIFNVIGDTLDGLGGGTAGYSDELETLSSTMQGYITAFGNLTPINPCGAYNSGTAYKPADCVSYNGISWICIQNCTGVTPSEGTYWQKMADPDASKADKVNGATSGNFAGLDANGNLTDSGSKASDFAQAELLNRKGTFTFFTSFTNIAIYTYYRANIFGFFKELTATLNSVTVYNASGIASDITTDCNLTKNNDFELELATQNSVSSLYAEISITLS